MKSLYAYVNYLNGEDKSIFKYKNTCLSSFIRLYNTELLHLQDLSFVF